MIGWLGFKLVSTVASRLDKTDFPLDQGLFCVLWQLFSSHHVPPSDSHVMLHHMQKYTTFQHKTQVNILLSQCQGIR